ncbi:hypothetical protein A3H26_02275 [candidate division WWE3 bacterium RIFCSPLOWO2_12_FULL_36_10]|uniref:Uncharacterized protein n=1 Tax=candidate division WWE3 bacterium RIFCSPLOWO2_12_FULL_36_10 TaxID=1802630 RepID=A0A1F4VGU7_UNCKA|nr:MAG: hypothetical protein A3H26_02275 [candidate division WWE3 bacterium RIFCSPLOWO2_12_FULL_36_10]
MILMGQINPILLKGEKAMATTGIDESGAVYDKDGFEKLWNQYIEQFPNAPVEITIRNFNDLERITMLSITLPRSAAVKVGLKVEWGTRIYGWRLNLADFLPAKAMNMLRAGTLRKSPGKANVPGERFIVVGQKLCDLLGRELTIDWRSGGGALNNKDSDSFTFFPKKPGKRSRKPVRKFFAGSWET